MPTNIYDFSLKRAVDGLARALKDIKQENGYNTNPKSQLGAVTMNSVPAGETPFLAFEMGDLNPASEQIGGYSQGLIRWTWPAFVWGFVAADGGRVALYDAGLALLVDLFAAIYSDEGLTDGAGQSVVHMVNPGEIVFDMEQFATDNRGYFLAEFQLVVDILRGESP